MPFESIKGILGWTDSPNASAATGTIGNTTTTSSGITWTTSPSTYPINTVTTAGSLAGTWSQNVSLKWGYTEQELDKLSYLHKDAILIIIKKHLVPWGHSEQLESLLSKLTAENGMKYSKLILLKGDI